MSSVAGVAAPPASKANVPVEEKAIASAGAANGYLCGACNAELTYKLLPPSPRMNAFKLSGEKVAVIALLIFRKVVVADEEAVLTT